MVYMAPDQTLPYSQGSRFTPNKDQYLSSTQEVNKHFRDVSPPSHTDWDSSAPPPKKRKAVDIPMSSETIPVQQGRLTKPEGMFRDPPTRSDYASGLSDIW